jgi:hypothetical protein
MPVGQVMPECYLSAQVTADKEIESEENKSKMRLISVDTGRKAGTLCAPAGETCSMLTHSMHTGFLSLTTLSSSEY